MIGLGGSLEVAGSGKSRGQFGFDDMFRGFEEMRREMERQFEDQLKNFQSLQYQRILVREYETPEGGKVREVGPIVYGYSMTIGPDGKPRVREFGNVDHHHHYVVVVVVEALLQGL